MSVFSYDHFHFRTIYKAKDTADLRQSCQLRKLLLQQNDAYVYDFLLQ